MRLPFGWVACWIITQLTRQSERRDGLSALTFDVFSFLFCAWMKTSDVFISFAMRLVSLARVMVTVEDELSIIFRLEKELKYYHCQSWRTYRYNYIHQKNAVFIVAFVFPLPCPRSEQIIPRKHIHSSSFFPFSCLSIRVFFLIHVKIYEYCVRRVILSSD